MLPQPSRSDRWCLDHPYEPSVDLCGWCGDGFCGYCLVYSFGHDRPPYCRACAVEAAGVRTSTGRRRIASRADQREFERRRRRLAANRSGRGPDR